MQKTEDLVLASVGNRFLASIIDNILIGILSLLLATLVGIPVLSLQLEALNTPAFAETYSKFYMVALPTSLFYRFLQESSAYQATFGKRIMKLKVVKVSGEKLNYRDSFIRNAVKELTGTGLLIFLYLVGIFHPQHQCVHDMLAKTYVVDRDVA